MLESIELQNFKSARCLPIKLAGLTVLTGLNGSGKSSVLQALALLKQSLVSDKVQQVLALRGALVRLGKSEEVRFENADTDDIGFLVRTSKGLTSLQATAQQGADTLQLRCTGDIGDVVSELGSGFQFIQADRITPAAQYEQASTLDRESGWLGCGGQFTVDFLLQNETMKVASRRMYPREHSTLSAALLKQIAPTESLLDQTAGWLQFLSPGVRLKAAALDRADATSLQFSYTGTSVDSGSREHRPSNVGFGLTYCLPIIVACLAAPAGALIMLENPEAHLHPQGQSALGLLLALCAADGVQIIVETHSDHVLNGIRLAAKRGEIANDNVAVHFFSRDIESGESSIASPQLHANGRFSKWPVGFFDEWSKALDELVDD